MFWNFPLCILLSFPYIIIWFPYLCLYLEYAPQTYNILTSTNTEYAAQSTDLQTQEAPVYRRHPRAHARRNMGITKKTRHHEPHWELHNLCDTLFDQNSKRRHHKLKGVGYDAKNLFSLSSLFLLFAASVCNQRVWSYPTEITETCRMQMGPEISPLNQLV